MEPELNEMPFNKDVTVSVEAQDPNNPTNTLLIYEQTISATNTVTGTSRYLFKSSESGIQELEFQSRTHTTYVSVSIDEADFLSNLRPNLTPDEYLALIRGIKTITFNVDINGVLWSAEASISLSTKTQDKQELNIR